MYTTLGDLHGAEHSRKWFGGNVSRQKLLALFAPFSSTIANFCLHTAAMSQQLVLRVKRLSPNAVLPFRATVGAAGYDLCRFAPKDFWRRWPWMR
jgi:hypothetical protein